MRSACAFRCAALDASSVEQRLQVRQLLIDFSAACPPLRRPLEDLDSSVQLVTFRNQQRQQILYPARKTLAGVYGTLQPPSPAHTKMLDLFEQARRHQCG